MQKQKTIYHLIVDKSGSMGDCIDNTITGFNEQVNKIQQLGEKYPDQEITIGLSTFNDRVFPQFYQSAPHNIKKLNHRTYIPSGATALLDAIGKSIDTIENEIKTYSKKLNTTVIIVILTDGYENASKSYKIEEIRQAISRLEETGKWVFSFIGATLDAVDVAESLSIKRQNSFAFEKKSMKSKVWNKLSEAMDCYLDKKMNGISTNENLFEE